VCLCVCVSVCVRVCLCVCVRVCHTPTFKVVGFERVTDVQRGHAQQHVGLQGLVAPHAKHQFAERSHNPVGTNKALLILLPARRVSFQLYFCETKRYCSQQTIDSKSTFDFSGVPPQPQMWRSFRQMTPHCSFHGFRRWKLLGVGRVSATEAVRAAKVFLLMWKQPADNDVQRLFRDNEAP